MLKNIDPVLSPELLKVLCEMGHGDEIVLADARTVTRWASEHRIGELSFWALGRDNGGCPGTPGSDDCSGVAQKPYEFTHLMLPFTKQ